jgi:hypothetical protein
MRRSRGHRSLCPILIWKLLAVATKDAEGGSKIAEEDGVVKLTGAEGKSPVSKTYGNISSHCPRIRLKDCYISNCIPISSRLPA